MNAFTTARLRATPLAPSDLDDLVDLHLDVEASRFLGGVRTPEKTAAYLDVNLQHWSDHGFGLWAFRTPDGAFVGRAGLRYTELEGVRELEIAYALARGAWGQGLASEIAQALVGLWMQSSMPSSLVGIVMNGNAASKRVLLKTGFAYERDAVFHDEAVDVFRQDRGAAA